MTDKPIIFSAPMVRALIEGRKTQTRRVAKLPGEAKLYLGMNSAGDHVFPSNGVWGGQWRAPYAAGDRLWVREAHAWPKVWDEEPDRVYIAHVWYPAGEQGRGRIVETEKPADFGKTRSPIHMPRWASRLTLVVTDVRVQRLQEISEADAIAEGCAGATATGSPVRPAEGVQSAAEDFADLWNSLHGPDAWAANPWVTAITFDVHRRNIDAMVDDWDDWDEEG